MVCAGYTKVWELAPGEHVKLDGARGTTLRVTRGTLWVTLEGDTRDIILTPGDSFAIDRGGLTIVEAQGSSTVCVLGHHVSEVHSPAPQQRGVGARLKDWLASVGETAMNRPHAPRY